MKQESRNLSINHEKSQEKWKSFLEVFKQEVFIITIIIRLLHLAMFLIRFALLNMANNMLWKKIIIKVHLRKAFSILFQWKQTKFINVMIEI